MIFICLFFKLVPYNPYILLSSLLFYIRYLLFVLRRFSNVLLFIIIIVDISRCELQVCPLCNQEGRGRLNAAICTTFEFKKCNTHFCGYSKIGCSSAKVTSSRGIYADGSKRCHCHRITYFSGNNDLRLKTNPP